MTPFTQNNLHNCPLDLPLAQAALLKDRILNKHIEPLGITAAQFKILISTIQFGIDTPAGLCRHLSLSSGAMTRMLDRLDQKNLLTRQRHETDRRQFRLILTEKGESLAVRLKQISADTMNELLGVLDPIELTNLERILRKVIEANNSATAL
ncbi:MarR family winged helix-turn-helix transcriptional regulator [Pseudomonas sp. LB3P14]